MILLLIVLGLGNQTISSFQQAKKYLMQLYQEHPYSFYCGCKFSGKQVLIESCGFKPKHKNKRAYRIEWEHVVPASLFGKTFRAWNSGNNRCVDKRKKYFVGRHCAAKTDLTYRYIEADLYNLVPSIGTLNEARADFSMGMIPDEKREFGACDFEIANGVVEPRPEIRGDIARIYFYMAQTYPEHVALSLELIKLLKQWDRSDAVDAWECLKAKRVEHIQGNVNFILKKPCSKL